jgi:hypothetical protein
VFPIADVLPSGSTAVERRLLAVSSVVRTYLSGGPPVKRPMRTPITRMSRMQ